MSYTGAPAPAVPLADVKWRVDSKPTQGKARFIPYVDAVTVARLLDDWVGPESWSDTYEPAAGDGLWCHLSIAVDGAWVTKTDLGVSSNTEKEKGRVSDAFKRAACLKWGVARNVYSLPTLFAPCREDSNGKAWPSPDTIPAILAELKKRGFTDDATGMTATAEHEEPEGPPLADEAAHKALRLAVGNLQPAQQRLFKKWRVDHGLAAFASALTLTPEQIGDALTWIESAKDQQAKDQQEEDVTGATFPPEGESVSSDTGDSPASPPALGAVRRGMKSRSGVEELQAQLGGEVVDGLG